MDTKKIVESLRIGQGFVTVVGAFVGAPVIGTIGLAKPELLPIDTVGGIASGGVALNNCLSIIDNLIWLTKYWHIFQWQEKSLLMLGVLLSAGSVAFAGYNFFHPSYLSTTGGLVANLAVTLFRFFTMSKAESYLNDMDLSQAKSLGDSEENLLFNRRLYPSAW